MGKGRNKKSSGQLLIHNGIIQARFNFTALEIKTLYAVALKIQNKVGRFAGQNIIEFTKENDDPNYHFTAKELCEYIGLKPNHYNDLERVFKKIMETSMTVRNGDNWQMYSFLNYAEYKDGMVIIEPNKRMLPFYSKLTNNYTPLELTTIMKFKSSYTIRVYGLIKQYHDYKKSRIFKLDELKKTLGVEKLYKEIHDFKVRVLELAKKELNEYLPELKFDYELIKSGRAFKEVKFLFDFSKIAAEKLDIELHSQAFDCFSKKDFGRRCAHTSAPANDKICSYCFQEIKTRY